MRWNLSSRYIPNMMHRRRTNVWRANTSNGGWMYGADKHMESQVSKIIDIRSRASIEKNTFVQTRGKITHKGDKDDTSSIGKATNQSMLT